MKANSGSDIYNKLILFDDWRIVYNDDNSAVFIPLSNNKNHWIISDEKLKMINVKSTAKTFN